MLGKNSRKPVNGFDENLGTFVRDSTLIVFRFLRGKRNFIGSPTWQVRKKFSGGS